jgi:hypothetical protein
MILNPLGLTNDPQRGSLIYMVDAPTWEKVEGWFYLHGNTVVRRKIGGRNTYAFCEEAAVLDFYPYKKEAAQ